MTDHRQTLRAARAALKTLGVNRLLADATDNPKLAKSLKLRVLTTPLHLAPHRLSGHNVCAMATAGCIAACLHTAGNPAYMAGKQRARIARTKAFFAMRRAFMVCLVDEIERHVKAARKARMKCGVRLNATSDIRWETVPCVRNGREFPNVMAAFPRVQFYDYTKLPNRRNLPANYHLTFSLADGNDADAASVLASNMSVAAVFSTPRTRPLPSTLRLAGVDWPVVDGDTHDYRPADPRGVVIGLRAKGKARGDASGFVRAA